jgi:hypothetical protein
LRFVASQAVLGRCALLCAIAGAFSSAAARTDGGYGGDASGIDWEAMVLKATGMGAPDVNALTPAQARFGAEKAARTDAMRELLEQVRRVQITAATSVGDAMRSDDVRVKVEGILRGYKVTAKRYYSDMGIEIDVEVPLPPLLDIFAPLAAGLDAGKPGVSRKFTGLVVDARKLKVVPALQPRLVDDSGQVIYAVERLSAEARKAGVASYRRTLNEALKDPRVADKPLLVRAAKGEGSDIVLTEQERKRLGEDPSFLADGRVIILCD